MLRPQANPLSCSLHVLEMTEVPNSTSYLLYGLAFLIPSSLSSCVPSVLLLHFLEFSASFFAAFQEAKAFLGSQLRLEF